MSKLLAPNFGGQAQFPPVDCHEAAIVYVGDWLSVEDSPRNLPVMEPMWCVPFSVATPLTPNCTSTW